jgi:hypothetical protein
MKKPRNKKYQPKPVRSLTLGVPIMNKDHDTLALGLHLSLVSLVNAPCELTYNALSRKVGTLRNAGMEGDFMAAGCEALDAIARRWHRHGEIEVMPSEAEVLKRATAAMDAAMPTLKVGDFKRAASQMDMYYESLNLDEKGPTNA